MKQWTKGEVAIFKNQSGWFLGTVTDVKEQIATLSVIKDGKPVETKFHFSRLLQETDIPEKVLETLIGKL